MARLLSWSLVIPILLSAPTHALQREDARPAQTELDLSPFALASRRGARTELVPVLAGDKVLVSSTLRLFALDARTGELVWSAGPPAGWDALEQRAREELFAGVDPERLVVSPACGERVAVAALQVPQSRKAAEAWQGITITRALPERRLFAFDLGTGRPLWNHAPPPAWDGSSGPFPQRMSVIGSPLVLGESVLVPCTSDESSIDYHVACYQLETGALLWTTFVVRGQVERNSFGRTLVEFAAAPLVAVPGAGHVLAQTGLGLVAALDLATGEILWRAQYTPIPPPKAKSYNPGKGPTPWRIAPPVVAGSVVLTAPPDSNELLAFDLGDGRALWAVSAVDLRELDGDSRTLGFDHLIGADADAIYLGGDKLSALTKPSGLASTEALRPLWTRPLPRSRRPRADLADELILVPGPTECLTLDRKSGEPGDSFPADGPLGLLLTDEALFVLTSDGFSRIGR